MNARIVIACLLALALIGPSWARDSAETPTRQISPPPVPVTGSSDRADTLFLFAAEGPGAYGMPGTTERGYSFDGPYGEPQEAGWFGVDRWDVGGPFWQLSSTEIATGHATDIGGALPFQFPSDPTNDFALWCGREYKCGWEHYPGFGNRWEQIVMISLPASTTIDLEFFYTKDCEALGSQWDHLSVYVIRDSGYWRNVFNDFSHGPTGLQSETLQVSGDLNELRDLIFLFHSSDTQSDEDGGYISDMGAVWLDNIVVACDGQVVFQSDFEDGHVPENLSFGMKETSGDYSELYPGEELPQDDPEFFNATNAWAFFDPETLGEGEWEGIPIIIYGGPYLDNAIQSPLLEIDQYGEPLSLNQLSQVLLDFNVYRAGMEFEDMLFFDWEVSAWVDGELCSRPFENDNYVWYCDCNVWEDWQIDITEALIQSIDGPLEDVDAISVRLGARDMCYIWCDDASYHYHNPGPFFDNVKIAVVAHPTGIESSSPSVSAILNVSPNPFNPATTLAFYLAEASPLKVEVFDVSGRRMATLWDGPQQAGEHELQWNGCNDRGDRLASGVYFLRFAAGEVVEERKLVLLKELWSRVVFDELSGDILNPVLEHDSFDHFPQQMIAAEFPPALLRTAA